MNVTCTSLPITLGDASKIPFPSTNHQADYTAHAPIPSSPNYTSRRAQALAKIHGCSIQPCDPHINPFQPSALPQPSNPSLDQLPAAGHSPMILQSDMTTTHFPQGDLNAERVGERINYSTTQQSHRPVRVHVCAYVQQEHLYIIHSISPCVGNCNERVSCVEYSLILCLCSCSHHQGFTRCTSGEPTCVLYPTSKWVAPPTNPSYGGPP